MFDFHLSTRIKFGVGARGYVNQVILEKRWRHVGILVDHNISKLAMISEIVEGIGKCVDREDIMYSAFLSGVALMHSGTGPEAAMGNCGCSRSRTNGLSSIFEHMHSMLRSTFGSGSFWGLAEAK